MYFYCFEGNVDNMAVTRKCCHRQRAYMSFCLFYNVVIENHSVQKPSPDPWVSVVGQVSNGLSHRIIFVYLICLL